MPETWGESSRRSRAGRFARHGVGALAAVSALLLGLAGPARASDLLTLNNTTAYVDPNITAEFVTIPNLCLEPYGDQGTTTGCDELGVRAVLAAQGLSPYGDIYFEDSTTLFATNAFVPQNPGSVSYGVFTGYSPIFSQHKYDLFGASHDLMGPYTREELLFLTLAYNGTDGVNEGTPRQTDPGESPVGLIATGYARSIITAVLLAPENDTTFDFAGVTFDVDNLPTFERITGITDGGKQTTIWNFCQSNLAPVGFEDLYCGDSPANLGTGILPGSTIVDFWVGTSGLFSIDTIDAFFPDQCPASDGTVSYDNCNLHEEWIDQVVTGYVKAWESLGGDNHFTQNFRSQLNFDHTVALNLATGRIVDQRIEQSVELSGAFTTEGSDPGDLITPGDNVDGEAGRQTFQQAVQTFGGQALGGIGQMTSQDVEGFLQECLNCNQTGGNQHSFQPFYLDLYYQPYQTGWDVVPTIVHGGT